MPLPRVKVLDLPVAIRKAAQEKAREVFGPTGLEGKGFGVPGLPPDNRRCQSRRCDGTGRQCKCWAMPGSRFCRKHLGKAKGAYVMQAVATVVPRGSAHFLYGTTKVVRMFYAQAVSKTLQEKLEAALSIDQSEQTELLEELAVMRLTVMDLVEKYDDAVILYDNAPTDAIRDKAQMMKIEIGPHLRDAIQEVADLASKIERNRAMRASQSGVSIHALGFLAKQFTELAYMVCGDDLVLAQRLVEGVRNIRLPNTPQEIASTLITPDQDVLLMDSTVPAEETSDEVPPEV